MAKTVVLKGGFVRKEEEASAAITPGHLVEFDASGTLKPHATVGGAARRAFALENDVIGKGIDDAYASGDNVIYGVFHQGAEVYAKLHAGDTCSKGDALESAGDGTLQVSSTPVEGSIVGWAMEDSSAAGARVRVEVA